MVLAGVPHVFQALPQRPHLYCFQAPFHPFVCILSSRFLNHCYFSQLNLYLADIFITQFYYTPLSIII